MSVMSVCVCACQSKCIECVCVEVEEEEAEEEEEWEEGGRKERIQNQKQKPHTSMWGTTSQNFHVFQRKVSEHPLRSAATRPAPCGVRFLPTVARPTRPRSPPAQLGKSSSSHRLTTGMMSYQGFA